MELQATLSTLGANDILPFAVSYDPVAVLAPFANAHGITYPLLSDEGSQFIDQLGIRNRSVEPTNAHYGIPYPGIYFIGADGRITDKVFHDTHRTRDAVTTSVREHFGLSVGAPGPHDRQETEALIAVAAMDSDAFVRGERIGLRVTIQTAPGVHISGRSLPEGYIATTLTVEVPETVKVEPVAYPAPHPLVTTWLDEELLVYEGEIALTTAVIFAEQRDDITLTATLHFQACTSTECFTPQQLTFSLPMHFRAFPP